jgi:hypothetical protein
MLVGPSSFFSKIAFPDSSMFRPSRISLGASSSGQTVAHAVSIGLFAAVGVYGGIGEPGDENSEPGPWMIKSQNIKAMAQATAVIAKIRASAPTRWS